MKQPFLAAATLTEALFCKILNINSTAMWDNNTKILNALDAWLLPRHRKIRQDDDVFHNFVLTVWNETKSVWNQHDVLKFIRDRFKNEYPGTEDTYAEQFIDHNVENGTAILRFLCDAKDHISTRDPYE